MAYKITFVGNPLVQKLGAWQRHFCKAWPQGLKPGESVVVEEIPHAQIHGSPKQFLVDGKPYVPPAPEKPKPKPVPKEK